MKSNWIKKHLKYLWYILKHKWFVFIECCKLGIPIRGLLHDMSKFLPSEYFPYVNYFYGNIKKKKDETGYYQPYDTEDDKFDYAWLLHQKRNDHHWQWWILPKDDGTTKIFLMSDKAKKEMLADWLGAGKAQGTPNSLRWWNKNKHKIIIHDNVRQWIEEELKKRFEKC